MDGRVSCAKLVILYHLQTNGPHWDQAHSRNVDREISLRDLGSKYKNICYESENVKKIEFIIAYLYSPLSPLEGTYVHFSRVYSAIQLTGFTGHLITTVSLQIYQTLTAQIDLSSGW